MYLQWLRYTVVIVVKIANLLNIKTILQKVLLTINAGFCGVLVLDFVLRQEEITTKLQEAIHCSTLSKTYHRYQTWFVSRFLSFTLLLSIQKVTTEADVHQWEPLAPMSSSEIGGLTTK